MPCSAQPQPSSARMLASVCDASCRAFCRRRSPRLPRPRALDSREVLRTHRSHSHLIVRGLRPFVLFAAAMLIAGCNASTGVCTTDFRYGIVVEVRDAVTHEAIA